MHYLVPNYPCPLCVPTLTGAISRRSASIWHAIFEIAVQDLAAAGRDGINVGGGDGVIYPIILGNKGDWSYLATWQHLYFALCLYTF